MQLLRSYMALNIFALVIDGLKDRERGLIDRAPNMYYSSGKLMINRAHERKLKVSTRGLVIQ